LSKYGDGMNENWFHELCNMIATEKIAVRVSVIQKEGSAPNSVGSAMTVSQEGFIGTIGGGVLEFEALREARKLVKGYGHEEALPWHRVTRNYPLGPALGQCCGGFVRLLFEPMGPVEEQELGNYQNRKHIVARPLAAGVPWQFLEDCKDDDLGWPLAVRAYARALHAGGHPRRAALVGDWYIEPLETGRQDLFLYGAGHVGRAVVNVLQDLPFKIYWVDTDRARFPDTVPENIEILVAADPVGVTRYAPQGAWHVVMTYSHKIDFNICHEALRERRFGYIGVIASKTKRARFINRLRKFGIPEALIAELKAPIGLPGLEAKEPASIAISLAADLLVRLQIKVEEGEPIIRGQSKEAV